MKKKRVAVIVGTRPEAVKLAPVIRALKRSRKLEPVTISTSQHQQLTRQILESFGVGVDHDLRVMRRDQTLWDLSGRLASKLGRLYEQQSLDAVLVQGDTTSAFFGGLCAFYHKIPVGHVEAGLRTGNSYSPFPEEMNRKLLGALATWHFPPTREAAKCLRREGVSGRTIYLTGNTVVDALRWMVPRCGDAPLKKLIGINRMSRRLILVTCHRRESFGQPMESVAEALAMLASEHAGIIILFPVHPNPAVRKAVLPRLSGVANVVLCEPLAYGHFLSCLKHAHMVLSDSGGVQEEATALGKPVLVLREATERQEGVRAGALKLVGTEKSRIVREAGSLLNDPRLHRSMCRASDVFGDGRAAGRIVQVLEDALTSAG